MFDESYTQLEVNEIAEILDVINKQVEGSVFDPLETTILSIDVPFYKDYEYLNIADHATNPPLQRNALRKKGTMEFTLIDYRYQTLYDSNSNAVINLSEENVADYVRFFYEHVKGRHGKFNICESADNIQWKDEPPVKVKKSLNETVKPLEILEKSKGGVYKILAFMMLKDALFTTHIYVDPTGRVTMTDHEILMEDIPVLDTAVGQ